MERKMIDLLQALKAGVELESTGFLVGARFHTQSKYTIFDITAFNGLRRIDFDENGVSIYSGGFKIYFVYEPSSYPLKQMEPYLRDELEKVPLRFEELDTVETQTRDRILISKKVQLLMGSFAVISPGENGFLYYFYPGPDAMEHVREFVSSVLHKDLGVDARLTARAIALLKPHLDYFDKVANGTINS